MGQIHSRVDGHYFSWAKSLTSFKLFIISTNLPRCPWTSIRKMTGWQRSKQPYTWKRNGKRVQGLGHKINCFKRHRQDLLSRAPRADYQVGQNTIITNPSSLTLSEQFPHMPPAYWVYGRASKGVPCLKPSLCYIIMAGQYSRLNKPVMSMRKYNSYDLCLSKSCFCMQELIQPFLLYPSYSPSRCGVGQKGRVM